MPKGVEHDEAAVLICGAGPTGLALACDLTWRGVPCRVIDRSDAPPLHSRALGVQARTLEVLDKLGVADELCRRGQRIHGLSIHAGRRRVAHVPMDLEETPFPFLLSVPQSETERLLEARLESLGGRVERQVELTGLTGEEQQVTATLRRVGSDDAPEVMSVPWLVGCDGAHSIVRKALNLTFEGESYEEVFTLADIHSDWDVPDDEATVFLAAEGPFAIIPLPGEHLFRLIVQETASSLPDREPTLEDFRRRLEERTGLPGALLKESVWMSRFRIHRRLASSYRVGRIFLAGDAAHIHSPIGGQGMNIGIQDAGNLAWKLALVHRGHARPELLDSYEEERRPIAASVLSGTHWATRMVTLRQPILQHLRNHLAPLLLQFEAVQHRLIRSIADLSFNYRDSSMVAEDRLSLLSGSLWTETGLGAWLDFGAAPRAGERVPEVVFHEEDEKGPSRLYDLLKVREHLLLVFSGVEATPEAFQGQQMLCRSIRDRYADRLQVRLIVPGTAQDSILPADDCFVFDPHGLLHHRFGAERDCLYLIRPDGYIGYRCQPADQDRLTSYLSRLFPLTPVQ